MSKISLAQMRLAAFLQSASPPSKIISNELPVAQQTLWHSSSHLLGAAMETFYGNSCFLTKGPATADGFFYDAFLMRNADPWLEARSRQSREILVAPSQIKSDISSLLSGKCGEPYFTTPSELKELSQIAVKLAGKNLDFEYITIPREAAKDMFISSPFKLDLIARIPERDPITIFRCGDFVDLCRGPHVANTRSIKALLLTKNSAAQWAPKSPQNLSRIYGVSFTSKQLLKDYKTLLIEAEKRNHRRIGKEQGLFTFHPHSPGSPFFLPHGTRIIQKLKEFLREEYQRFGFQEVITPLLFNKELWKTSGHWTNYKDDMFVLEGNAGEGEVEEAEEHGLKPMNCPGHCLLFADTAKSFRDLPLRFAEFSPLHRNESSGALTGLTRVRKFHQDDGHIFCTLSQIEREISQSLQFVDRVYRVLGFPDYQLTLSTRPVDKYIGSLEDWGHAEDALRTALDTTGKPWTVKEGDGAFYGPKIDIMIHDALGKQHQTATIQLDFQLPKRFALVYNDSSNGKSTPIIIHRAVLGSLERFLGILIESYAGKWPFWISPRQAMVIATRPELKPQAEELQKVLAGGSGALHTFYVDVNRTNDTLSKQIRDAQMMAYNYVLVLGDREVENGTVTVRAREGNEQLGEFTPERLLEWFAKLAADRSSGPIKPLP